MVDEFVLAQVDSVVQLAAVVGVAAFAVLAVGAVWLWHAVVVGKANQELEAYKSQVVALSDKIDALKERHKILPYMDQDFTAPMAGETLAAYNAIAEQLGTHRAEWLKLMDAWEAAQTLVKSEWLLGRRRAQQARQRIRSAAVTEALAALERDCQAPLDRLEQAHDQVAAKLQGFAEQQQQMQTLQQALQAAAITVDAYQAEGRAAQNLAENARSAVPADPLAAIRCLEQAHAGLSQLSAKTTKMLDHAGVARETGDQMVQVAQLAAQRRSQGFFLQEVEVDPDPQLAAAAQQLAAARKLMDQADEPAAGAAVSQAAATVEQARQAVEQHVAARAKCESEIPERQSESRRLAEFQAAARGQRAELERDFAPEAWVAVADNAAHAEGFRAAAQQLIEQAAQNSAPHVQHYTQASRLLDQAAASQQHAERALVAIGERLRELVKIRGACQAQFSQVMAEADGVGRLLRSSTADRVPANERFRTASAGLQRVAEESRIARPDWTQLASRLGEIERDLKRAEKLAQEDAQLAEQAIAEIEETEAVIGQARGFFEMGFRPDVSAADAHLSQARLRLAAQEYEEAIRIANAAERQAREACNQARMRARQRQAELEAQRQAEAAARARTFLAQPPEQLNLPAEAEEPPMRQSQMI